MFFNNKPDISRYLRFYILYKFVGYINYINNSILIFKLSWRFRNFADFILDIIPFFPLEIFDKDLEKDLEKNLENNFDWFLKKNQDHQSGMLWDKRNERNLQCKNKTYSIIAKTKSISIIRKKTHFNINSTYFLLIDCHYFNKIQHR